MLKTKCVVALNLFLLLMFSAPSAHGQNLRKYVFAPVFFVTDRIPEKRNGVVTFKNEEQAISNTTSGIQYVAVPVRKDIIDTWQNLHSLGWIGSNDDPGAANLPTEAFNNPKRFEASIRALSQIKDSDGETIGAVKKLVQSNDGSNSSRDEVIVYVHGFNNDFNAAMSTGAELSSWFKKPVFVYSWMTKSVVPVPSELLESYRQSEVTYQHSQERYDAFMKALEYAVGAPNMVLIAHSMGNRLLEQWLLVRHAYNDLIPESSQYREVIMSNPDVDGRYFLSHIDRLCDETKYLRVFFSTKDRAIEFSKKLHGDYYRMGSPNNSLFAQLRHSKVHLVNMTNLERDWNDLVGHTMPCWLVSSFHKYNSVDKTAGYTEERPYNDDEMVVLKRKK